MPHLPTISHPSIDRASVFTDLKRICLKSVCALLLCLVLVFGTQPPPAAAQSSPRIRYEAHTPDGKKNLESLERTLKTMKDSGCENPLSWYYQGAIHWIPTKDSDISGLQEGNPLCLRYSGFTEIADGVYSGSDKLLASWDNCTHAPNEASQSSTIHFLPWHRLFVYHFEKIVRELSGDKNFTLPYWNYINLSDTDIPSPTRRTMPDEFRLPATSEENSLYESARDWSLTNGAPLSENLFLPPNVADGVKRGGLLKAVEELNDKTTYADFNDSIDDNPHGIMHDYIGGGFNETDPQNQELFNPIYNRAQDDGGEPQFGLMRNVPSAGFDPIFWMHHGNIDRLWGQWTQEKHVTVTSEELELVSWPYEFFEPNGDVKAYTMQQVFDSVYDMDYEYDDGTSPNFPVELNLRTLMANQIRKTLLGSNQTQKTVGSDQEFTQTVPLTPLFRNQLLRQLDSNQLRSGDTSSQPNYTVELDVTYIGRPRGIYEVYLNLPNDESARNSAIANIDPYFVGTISFFVLEADRPTTKKFQFDITDELLLQIQNLEEFNGDSASISIRKQGGSVDETLTVDKLAIYTHN